MKKHVPVVSLFPQAQCEGMLVRGPAESEEQEHHRKAPLCKEKPLLIPRGRTVNQVDQHLALVQGRQLFEVFWN